MPTPSLSLRLRNLLRRLLVRSESQQAEAEFRAAYRRRLAELQRNPGGKRILPRYRYDAGPQPVSHIEQQCAFAAEYLEKKRPARLLDIGSDRHFVLGLLARYPVTTLDVRPRTAAVPAETVLVGDAKKLDLPDESFPAVLSLCALEHFGLGRYGDEFDLTADQAALSEMIRVLQPGGYLIFTTTLTRATPAILFNAARVYDHAWIQERCSGLLRLAERFYSRNQEKFVALHEVTTDPEDWDIYLGCWAKPEHIVYPLDPRPV